MLFLYIKYLEWGDEMLNFIQPKNVLEDPLYKLSLEPFQKDLVAVLDYFQTENSKIKTVFNTLKNNLKKFDFLEQLYLPQLNYYINELKKIIGCDKKISQKEKEFICQKIIAYCLIPLAKNGINASCKIVSTEIELIDNDQTFLEEVNEQQAYTMKSDQGEILFLKNDTLIKKLSLSENPFLYYFNNKLIVKNSFINEIDGISIEFLKQNLDEYTCKINNQFTLNSTRKSQSKSIENVFYYRSAFKLIKDVWPAYYLEMKGTIKFLNILPYKDVEGHTNSLLPKIIFLPHIENDFMKVSELLVNQCAFLRLQHLTAQDELIRNDSLEKVFSVNHREPVSVKKVFFETFASMRVALWLEKLYSIYPTGAIYHRLDLASYELCTNINLLKRKAEFTAFGRELWLELVSEVNVFLEKRVQLNFLDNIN